MSVGGVWYIWFKDSRTCIRRGGGGVATLQLQNGEGGSFVGEKVFPIVSCMRLWCILFRHADTRGGAHIYIGQRREA